MSGCIIENIFKQPELVSKYTCPECNSLLHDAVQPSCGHWLCQSCADVIIARGNDPCCPRKNCGEPFTPEDDDHDAKLYFPDRFVRKEILGLSISCKFHHKGCDWEGKFVDLKEHLKICDYNSTTCEYCHKSLRSDELTSHKTECPQVPKKCPLSKVGCGFKELMTGRELEDHFDSSKYQHMEILVDVIARLEGNTAKLPQDRRDDPDGKCDSGFSSFGRSDLVEADCATTHSRVLKKSAFPKLRVGDAISEIDYTPQILEKRMMTVFDEEVSKVRSELHSSIFKELRAKDEEIASLKSTILKLEKNMRSKNSDYEDRDFRLSLIENSNYDGTMVWKIPQFSQRMTDAESGKYTSIFSLPFYTGRYGYKMCLRLYILGDGIGKGSYMSLFFVLMKGEFDNILQWPFTHKVTFKLINQGSGRDVVDTFQPDPMSSSFRKPKSDMNIASGCPRFVSHADLKSGGYTMDDTVFIKCIIDTSTIKHP